MRTKFTRQTWWQQLGIIRGFEGESDGGEGGGNEGDPGNQGNSGGEGGSGGANSPDGTGGFEGGQGGNEDISGLKSALEKERTDRKKLEKELKAFQKAQQEAADKEKTEVQRLSETNTKNAEKVQKLAAKFRTSAVENAIVTEARKLKFTDPTDAIRAEVLSAISVEQDEDDPTRVDIDGNSVKNAVKELAKLKPHYLSTQEGSDGGRRTPPPSGSKFGGNNNRQAPQDQKLAALYPALSNRL